MHKQQQMRQQQLKAEQIKKQNELRQQQILRQQLLERQKQEHLAAQGYPSSIPAPVMQMNPHIQQGMMNNNI